MGLPLFLKMWRFVEKLSELAGPPVSLSDRHCSLCFIWG